MAGDQKDIGAPEIDVSDPFEQMNGILGSILRALTTRGDETVWDLTGNGSVVQSQHIRFRVALFVFSVDAAATVTLTMGTTSRTFSIAGADVRTIPLPLVVERGTDVQVATTAGNLSAYLVGVPE